jgi:hypothetical protein
MGGLNGALKTQKTIIEHVSQPTHLSEFSVDIAGVTKNFHLRPHNQS